MEKIININFQGRIIAIEETAYDVLKKYIDSLRRHFASEESNDEIINDIENRIAELLSERLKQGASCIGMAELNTVMDSIGRIEDIEAAEADENMGQKGSNGPAPESNAGIRGNFFRNTDDKVIAGVCSGIAVRTGIDPMLVRVMFVILSGALFWIYILLWVVVPEQSMRSNVVKRLYRNPDDKMIAGVCGGLAAYFKTDTWILRAVFAIPLIIGFSSGDIFGSGWDMGWGPRVFAGSFGGTMLVFYVILWIVTPYASSDTDKMEMRGEKIDLNTIKAATQARTGNMAQAAGRAGSSIGKIIGVLFKAFFIFIAAMCALSLFGVLIGLVFAGSATMPYTSFLFESKDQHMLAWVGIALTMGVPLLALITWVVRRLMGVKSHHHYLGYVFAVLWVGGVVCALVTAGSVLSGFSTREVVEETYMIQQPSVDRLYITVSGNEASRHHARHDRWFGDWEDDDAPFRYISSSAMWLNNVKVNIEQSEDSLYHIYGTKASRGKGVRDAKERAEHIAFAISQADSVVSLPEGFVINNKDKFHNQQVLVTVEVPLGKKVHVSNEVNDYSWYNISSGGHRRYERHWSNGNRYDGNTEYIMTATGLLDPQDTVGGQEDD